MSNHIYNKPMISLATNGNLTDVLSSLPLASPIGYHVDDLDLSATNINIFDPSSLKLHQLTDPYLVDCLNRALSQIDTSKIQLKTISSTIGGSSSSHDHEKDLQTKNLNYSPLIQTCVSLNPKLFNGALSGQVAFQRSNHSNQTMPVISPKQQQSPSLKHMPVCSVSLSRVLGRPIKAQ
jgi:hypothetical protein